MKEVLWVFAYIKEEILSENYKEVYKLWREWKVTGKYID